MLLTSFFKIRGGNSFEELFSSIDSPKTSCVSFFSENIGFLLVSQGPHRCYGRELRVRTANGHQNANEDQYYSVSDYPSQDPSMNEYFESDPMENNAMYDEDDDSHNQLASLRDELDANLECMDIDHKRQVKSLQEKLAREKKHRDQEEELYREAEEDWRSIQEENLRLRTNLIKNVIQTFNIRRDFARRTKEQQRKCQQLTQSLSSSAKNS